MVKFKAHSFWSSRCTTTSAVTIIRSSRQLYKLEQLKVVKQFYVLVDVFIARLGIVDAICSRFMLTCILAEASPRMSKKSSKSYLCKLIPTYTSQDLSRNMGEWGNKTCWYVLLPLDDWRDNPSFPEHCLLSAKCDTCVCCVGIYHWQVICILNRHSMGHITYFVSTPIS